MKIRSAIVLTCLLITLILAGASPGQNPFLTPDQPEPDKEGAE